METQRKKHCKSYRERHREKLFASFLHPTTIKAWNFKTQIIRASSWWKTQTLHTHTHTQRRKACLLGGMELEAYYWKQDMVFLCSDDEFVAAICWFNDRSNNSSSSRQTEEGRKRRFLTTTPFKYLYSFLSLSLSLSLFSPQKQEKKKEVKLWSCKWSTPHKTKTTKAKNLCWKWMDVNGWLDGWKLMDVFGWMNDNSVHKKGYIVALKPLNIRLWPSNRPKLGHWLPSP